MNRLKTIQQIVTIQKLKGKRKKLVLIALVGSEKNSAAKKLLKTPLHVGPVIWEMHLGVMDVLTKECLLFFLESK